MIKIQANTFTPLYDEIEDRIRLIINYKDLNNRVDLMLTRAFIVRLIPHLEDYLVQNFDLYIDHQEEIETNYITQTEQIHVDSVVREELLKQVDLTLIKNTNNILIIFYTNNVEVKALLNKEMLKAFLDNLKKSIPKYNWGIFL